MAKINDMASLEEKTGISSKIVSIKSGLGVTYNDLNRIIGKPCTTSTLQIRASYPKKPLSKKLLNKISSAISSYVKALQEKITQEKALSLMKEEFMSDMSEHFDKYVKRREQYFRENPSRH